MKFFSLNSAVLICILFLSAIILHGIFFKDTSSPVNALQIPNSSNWLNNSTNYSTKNVLQETTSQQAQIELLEEAVLEIDRTDCDQVCASVLDALLSPKDIDDESYEKLLGSSGALAAYLASNAPARAEMIQTALTTDDGNKRNYIVETFRQLDPNSQLNLGRPLIESPLRTHRMEGIDFLSSSDAMDFALATELSSMLQSEGDEYVRRSLINVLNQPDKFFDDQAILSDLFETAQNDPNIDIRGQAILAGTSLTSDPEQFFSEAMAILGSSEETHQLYGIRALNIILNKHVSQEIPMNWSNEDAVRKLFDGIVNNEFEHMSESNRRELDKFYNAFSNP